MTRCDESPFLPHHDPQNRHHHAPPALSAAAQAAIDALEIASRLSEMPSGERRSKGRQRVWSSLERLARRFAIPVAGVSAAFALANHNAPSRLGPAVLVGAIVWLSYRLTEPRESDAAFLPLMRTLFPIIAPILALGMLLFLKGVSVVEGMSVEDLLVVGLVIAIASFLRQWSWRLVSATRRELLVGVVGSARTASDLMAELREAQTTGYRVVGYILPPGEGQSDDVEAPMIGRAGELAAAVKRQRLDLLLVSSEIPRLGFFDEIAATCLHLPVRVRELSAFYEETLGHVPIATINSAWFQWVVHPRFTPAVPAVKRSIDVVIAGAAALVYAPLFVILALLIKRDGGPIFYRQTRIGEGGKPFVMLKLRSMRAADPDADQAWSSLGDDRVTPVGRFLRRSHLDEVPQFVNVLRGEMSIVGPRPEQPAFVERLEGAVAFYTRRHLVRPGITGWAQIQCGYSGSDAGSALKVCHDLYYLKHRSVALDLLILGETIRTLFADRQWEDSPLRARRFVHQGEVLGATPSAAIEPRPVSAVVVGLGGRRMSDQPVGHSPRPPDQQTISQ